MFKNNVKQKMPKDVCNNNDPEFDHRVQTCDSTTIKLINNKNPPFGGARGRLSTAPLHLKISADILCVIADAAASNSDRII